ncbi:MAG: 16S rRNA (cytosine(1402)-N(4))-methyltransferase RsmH [Gammaproteobacteria bacterium]|nr:16S rRNA (cytosine(1402)-N(4))-methyltransferase RsmH [Gammaproteobacteria bacterium]MDH5661080.1 16S rRNA (cytosine(1402)-N(4))-methyltransferase RsmH [Gammaproteobacteria bacterium]
MTSNASSTLIHKPVLLEETLTALNIKPNGCYVDGTFGRGGHSQEILKQLNENGKLLAFDKDPQAIAIANTIAANDERLHVKRGSFTQLKQTVEELGWKGKVDGIFLDLGVSSPQLDDAERGFSFQSDGPLDMRMDPENGLSASQWLASAEERDIMMVLFDYGEEKFARRIASAIVAARQEQPINTTKQLASIVTAANPSHEKNKNPATRTFQAIRIFINQELDDLKTCLAQAVDLLAPGGRLVVISFHSLEDRIVKRFIREQCKGDDFPVDLPVMHEQLNQNMKMIGKAIKAGREELNENPRARSAVLRVAERLA